MRNFVDGDKVNIRATKYVEFGEWNFDTQTWISKKSGYNAVKVTYGRTKDHREGELDMLLTPFMGVNYVSLGETQSSIAAFRTRDLCLVMDVTFSFVGELPQAKQAALNLLDTMYDQNIPGDQICLVVFVGDSKLVTSLDDIYANKTAIRATWDGGAAVEKSPPCTRTTTNPHGQWECKENQWHLKRKILYYYWDGTYVFSETETEEYISGYKEETYYETELTGYERVPYTVSVEYEETETYQVSVKESYTERYEEDYDCKKFKMVTVPYTYTVEKRFEECKDVTSKKKESYTYYEEVPYKKKEKYWTWWYEKAERTVPYTHTYTVKYTEPEKFKVCKSVTKYKDLPVYIYGKYTETTTERYRDSWEATKTIKEEYDCSYVETWTEEVAYECGKDVTYYEVEEKECGKWKKVKVPYEKDCSYWDTKTTTEYYDCGGWVATYGKEAYDCSSVKPGGRGRGRSGEEWAV